VLGEEAKKWATPKASDPQHAGPNMRDSSGGMPLPAQAVNWPTPNARDHKGSPDPKNRDRMTGQLDEAAERKWATPQARDYRSPDNPQTGNYKRKVEKGWTIDLNTQAAHPSPPAPTESGAESPKPSTQRLNPKFVEWLMGLPDGWTSSGCSATELSRYKRLMRFALYSNESPTNHE
jgi:hypothetical protein